MNIRIQSIDFVRAAAIIVIFLSHYFLYGHISQLESLGQFLAGTFNVVFFCVSAFLYGLSWDSNDCKPISVLPFMKKRLLRLASSYWPWLVVVFFLFYILSVPFTAKDVIMNFAFLSWFDKMPGVGHFWFVTMIMICYASFAFISHLGFLRKMTWGGNLF